MMSSKAFHKRQMHRHKTSLHQYAPGNRNKYKTIKKRTNQFLKKLAKISLNYYEMKVIKTTLIRENKWVYLYAVKEMKKVNVKPRSFNDIPECFVLPRAII